jgi:hypothetical protein
MSKVNPNNNAHLLWATKFQKSTKEHIELVQMVCRRMNGVSGMPATISEESIVHHDRSKFGKKELNQYAQWFFAPGQEKDEQKFKKAFYHHIFVNPHHWRHWLSDLTVDFILGRESECKEVEVMPPQFVMEMIADWLAFGYQYTGSWDMSQRMNDNDFDTDAPKVILHPESKGVMNDILIKLGWDVSCDNTPLYCLIDPSFINSLPKTEEVQQ